MRYRLHGDPAHQFTEAIGMVQSVSTEESGPHVSLVNKRGEVVDVAVSDIEAAKVL